MSSEFSNVEQLRDVLKSEVCYGTGKWDDLSGLIVPENAVNDLLDAVENGSLNDISQLNKCFADLHADYYDYEWAWAYQVIEDYYHVDLSKADELMLSEIVCRWRNSVVGLDNLVYEDARNEFVLSGNNGFESDPFVTSVREHIRVKTELAEKTLAKLRHLAQ